MKVLLKVLLKKMKELHSLSLLQPKGQMIRLRTSKNTCHWSRGIVSDCLLQFSFVEVLNAATLRHMSSSARKQIEITEAPCVHWILQPQEEEVVPLVAVAVVVLRLPFVHDAEKTTEKLDDREKRKRTRDEEQHRKRTVALLQTKKQSLFPSQVISRSVTTKSKLILKRNFLSRCCSLSLAVNFFPAFVSTTTYSNCELSFTCFDVHQQ